MKMILSDKSKLFIFELKPASLHTVGPDGSVTSTYKNITVFKCSKHGEFGVVHYVDLDAPVVEKAFRIHLEETHPGHTGMFITYGGFRNDDV